MTSDYLRSLSRRELRAMLDGNPLDPNDGSWAFVEEELRRRRRRWFGLTRRP